MSDKRLKRKRGTTAATMETQRGAKAPLVSSLSQSLSSLAPLQIFRAASHGVAWANVVHLGSPKDRNTQMKEQLKKTCFPSSSLSADRFGLSKSSVFITRLSSPFHYQTAYYPLHRDITSTQTSSRCLSWKVRALFKKVM